MKGRFLDRFDVILLDMGNTFMFDVDRFGENEDYHATYRNLGGRGLNPEEVRALITEVLDRMLSTARDPARVDDFGDVWRFLRESRLASALPPPEMDLIVKVFARHELGTIPEGHIEALRRLRNSHPLGLVSNVWSPSRFCESALEKASIRDLFAVRVWSSDYLSIKPSSRLFQIALNAFPIGPARMVYVGDNPKRDVAGAKAMGMAAVWIKNDVRPLTPEIPEPDYIISALPRLVEARIGEGEK